MHLEHFTGWKLEDVRAELASRESTLPVLEQLVETVAPLRKNQSLEGQAAKLGAWRVLRAMTLEAKVAGQNRNEIELVIAREQLVD